MSPQSSFRFPGTEETRKDSEWESNLGRLAARIGVKNTEQFAVSRSGLEALKRFPDYEELSDGTLMRIEGNKEFRIYWG
jgi:hypothetical protein